MTIKEEFEELLEIRSMIENPAFQKFIVSPLRERQEELRLNFFSDSLKESWRKGGRYEGIEDFFNTLKQIDIQFKNKKFELDSEEGK